MSYANTTFLRCSGAALQPPPAFPSRSISSEAPLCARLGSYTEADCAAPDAHTCEAVEAGACQQDQAAGRWAGLPDDILQRVLDMLPPASWRVLRLVCTAWSETAGRHALRLRPEKLDGRRLAARFPHLRSLDLSDCDTRVVLGDESSLDLQSGLTDASLAGLTAHTSLTELSLQECHHVTGRGLSHLRHLSQLRQLDLSHCQGLQDSSLAALAACTSLRGLHLRGCLNIHGAGLPALRPLVQLDHISLGGSRAFTDDSLAHLTLLTSLCRVDIVGCPGITDAGLLSLTQLPGLKRVVVSKCRNITGEGLERIQKCECVSAVNVSPPSKARRMHAWMSSLLSDLDMLLHDL
ncbi:hypothetical protein WJX72_009302 [[Myrmecia] bisecta]|uniref:F-box domain-containing protein n=1 Tax=[Myrmecia] bisecta TaxID=41462 RepID=A0AAW1Q0Y2_9CHLO